MYDAYLFDLDGTLLDTLPDLTNITNMALAEWGMPLRTSDEINSFVGNGARMLMQRAAAEGTSDEEVDRILARWKELYPEYGHKYTKPYPGTPLRTGSRGEDVRLVQTWLNRIGAVSGAIPELAEDGIYGPRTAEAVRIWQRIAGLDPTGAVASYTWASLSDAYRALEEGKYGAEGQSS